MTFLEWLLVLGIGYIVLVTTAQLFHLVLPVSQGASIDRYYLLKFMGWGVFIHKIHDSDPPALFHNHPWSGLSLIWGGYMEETWVRAPDGIVEIDVKIRRFLNWVPAARHHRVIVRQPVWTLFIHGPKSNVWSVIDHAGKVTAEAPWEGAGVARSYSEASKAILISCHNRIEEREGYELYKRALARGQRTVKVTYLGSGQAEDLEVAKLDPYHFAKVDNV